MGSEIEMQDLSEQYEMLNRDHKSVERGFIFFIFAFFILLGLASRYGIAEGWQYALGSLGLVPVLVFFDSKINRIKILFHIHQLRVNQVKFLNR